MTRLFIACCLVLSTVFIGVTGAQAHALHPGYLELGPLGEDTWRVFWRKPDVQGRPMAIRARLPETCDRRYPPEPRFDGAAWVAQWVARCPGGLTGGEILVEGLDQTSTDVLVRYELAGEDHRTSRLTPADPRLIVPVDPGALEVLYSYLMLGIEHILGGIDHLLFVFALLLLIRDRWRLVGTITAFTLAHSLTLAAAVLGLIVVPGPPVEAVIALSIMFLAVEVVKSRHGELRLSERWPWVVAFLFGLLHGIGFAGALLDIGLPPDDIPLALLSFNVGVEIGQLFFVAMVLFAGWCALRLIPMNAQHYFRVGGSGTAIFCYAIGGVASYWFIERLSGF